MTETTGTKGKVVKYISSAATVREITAAQWKKAGADGQKLTRWSRHNGWTIPVSEFTNDAMNIIEKDKRSFAVVDS